MTDELRWRTSSRSDADNCIEVATLPWRTSNRCSAGACVEIAATLQPEETPHDHQS
jgi:hypothetical protein